MASSGLQVDPASLKAAGSQAATASAHPTITGVDPCADDAVSTRLAAQLNAQMHLVANYTQIADATAHQFGVLLNTNAASYEQQEQDSAATLGIVPHPSPTPVPAMPSPPTKELAPPWTFRPGEPPSSPRHIAELVHSGPGSMPMRVAASGLRSDAGRLESAADQLASTASQARDAWTSDSADLATGHIGDLHTWYLGHAEHVRGLAGDLDAHADQFDQVRAAVPTPAQIDQAERELRAASDANIRSHGQLSAAVSRAQANLSRVQQAAVTGYGNYTIATAALVPQVPAPPPAPPIGPTPASKSKAADSGNDGPPADQKPQHTRAGDPVKPVDAGPGTDQISGGPTWPAGDVPPANVRPTASDPDPLVGPDPVTAPVAEALPAVVPTIVGTIVGSTGGALGGLAGAAPRMLGGLGSAAPAALTGLGNPVGEPPGGEPGGGEPQAPEASGGMPQVPHVPDTGGTPNLDPPGGIGGGGSGGGIEPSGVADPLAPAVGMVAVPDAAPVAAPVSAASPGAGAAEAGVGPGGMMMPPFFPPGRGQGSMSEADRKLYPQRRLKVIAPPNSEPVLRRREGRQITKEPEGGGAS